MKYPWPASALTADDMHLLYNQRESADGRKPITTLISEAVREMYGRHNIREGESDEA